LASLGLAWFGSARLAHRVNAGEHVVHAHSGSEPEGAVEARRVEGLVLLEHLDDLRRDDEALLRRALLVLRVVS